MVQAFKPNEAGFLQQESGAVDFGQISYRDGI
jgi:hypothetical protein